MLYLDKAWSLLQCDRTERGGTGSSGLSDVRGQVTQTGMGHLPFVRVLTPAEVVDVAKDLADISDQEVADRLRTSSTAPLMATIFRTRLTTWNERAPSCVALSAVAGVWPTQSDDWSDRRLRRYHA